MRVLIAEDEFELAKGLKFLLEKNKFSVDAVHDGARALECFGSGDYDVVVLDIINSIMPGLLSILLVFGLVRLIKKGHKPITLVFGILLISIVLAFFGIF